MYDYRVERASRALVTVTVISGVVALVAGLVGAGGVIGSVKWVGGGIAVVGCVAFGMLGVWSARRC